MILLIYLICLLDGESSTAGIGLVAPRNPYDAAAVLTIYKDKTLTRKLQDFHLYKPLTNIRPFKYKPDYGQCHFICLEKTESYYRILINDTEEGYVKNDGDTYFYTWESIFLDGPVSLTTLEGNPVRNQPRDNAQSIGSPDLPIFHVHQAIQVKGEDWIRVQFSKSGEINCTDGPKDDCNEGWIRWRKNDKLLVDFFLGG